MSPRALEAPSVPKSLRVLLVEDSKDDADLLLHELARGGYKVVAERVETADAMRGALQRGSWDAVLSDYSMPTFSAPEALKVLQESKLDLPFIIISGTIGEEAAVAALKAGASDFLVKGKLARLIPALERELHEAVLRSERTTLEGQLRQSQKMEGIGRLAGGVAHDFNNLLTAILGYSEMLLADMPSDNPDRLDIEEIKSAGERAAGLTKQLLAFSRQQVLEPRVLNLNDVIVNIEKLLRRVIGEDVELSIELDRDVRPVRIDPGQMEQVLMNLAVNARDAMPTGGRLTVRTEFSPLAQPHQLQDAVLDKGEYVLVTVSDTGSGIPPEIAARIFEPFFTTKEPGKGTGLGLSTVYGIVKQSGGAVFVNSEQNSGTEFGMYFPCVDAPIETAAPAHAHVPVSVRGTETVLVVDDEAGIRDLVRKALERHGYRVLSAANGADALSLVGAYTAPIHLVITDVVMPQMGGREMAARLASMGITVPVLFVSGYLDLSHLEIFALPAEQAHLTKPFTPTVLMRNVRELLDESSSRRQKEKDGTPLR
jgi:two-component system, cell cycle sensor histidine kinase and response regulator CckA